MTAGLRIKVCGVTRLEDAAACLDAGVDLVGLNFVPASPRRLDLATARALALALRGRALVVGVVADLEEAAVRALVADVGLDRVQLHGDEPPALVASLGALAWKAVRVGDEGDVARARAFGGEVLVVDAKVEGALGGTGRRVDAALVRDLAASRPVLLAGGLAPGNVAEAVRAVRPWGVDVASGVEASPGVKDARAIAAFARAARAAAGEPPADGV